MTGAFVVLEGADGTGTTTQMEALATLLRARGKTVHTTCEPSSRSIGREIRARLSRPSSSTDDWRALALLFAADRLDHLEHEIRPRVLAGDVVISDRYVLSSFVYQSLHVDESWVRALNQHAPPPDVTLLISLDLDVALARIASRKGTAEVYDDRALQERIHAAYARHGAAMGAHVVDGDAPPDVVTARITAVLEAAGVA